MSNSKTGSKIMSLCLAVVLVFGVFAAVQLASTTAWAETITNGAGDQYEINFATDGDTATLNGITATTEVVVDLSEDGWGWNPETDQSEKGERISFPFRFSGTAEADGCLTITISGDAESGGTFIYSFNVFVKEGKAIENNIGNTLYYHLSMKAMEVYGSLNNIETTLDFEPMDTYELYISNLDEIESNGVYFNFWAGGTGGGGYFAANEYVGFNLWADGIPVSAGIYSINVSSDKAGINATRTLDVNAKVGQIISENLMEESVEYETYFYMPEKDVDDFVFTVEFTPSGGGKSTSTSTSKGSSNNSNSLGSNNTLPSAPAPVTQTSGNIKDLASKAKSSGENIAKSKGIGEFIIQGAAWVQLAGLTFQHDTVTNGAVQVRVIINNPASITRDTKVSGYVTGPEVDRVRKTFDKFFSNKTRVMHLDQTGSWGQAVQIVAKLNLTGMNIKNLEFYSYDSFTNTYKQIQIPGYWIDSNGYTHLTTQYAGDIIVTDGPLVKK